MDQASGERDRAFRRAHVDLDAARGLVQPWKELGARAVGVAVVALPAGEGATFTHSHARQEEVYVVLEGAGVLLIDGEELSLARGDLVRVGPAARRALAASPTQRLLVLVAGAALGEEWQKDERSRYLIDDGVAHYDDPPPWAANDPAALARNAELADRRARSTRRAAERRDSP